MSAEDDRVSRMHAGWRIADWARSFTTQIRALSIPTDRIAVVVFTLGFDGEPSGSAIADKLGLKKGDDPTFVRLGVVDRAALLANATPFDRDGNFVTTLPADATSVIAIRGGAALLFNP